MSRPTLIGQKPQDKLVDPISPTALARRRLFAGAGTAGALAAVAAVLPLAKPGGQAVLTTVLPEPASGGYQLTEHVLRYYETARV